jgi:DNA-binding NarL/FixJ family response regulator
MRYKGASKQMTNKLVSECLDKRKRKLLIVDDHPIVRRGLADVLARALDLEVREGADNVTDALKEAEDFRPDLIVVDVTLRDSSGIDLISKIKASGADVKTIVWSMFDEKMFAERAMQAGAMGYVNKREPIEKVVQAVGDVLDGKVYLSPEMTTRLLQRACGVGTADGDPIQRLSNRELGIFQMLGSGMTSKQIARKLNLSPKTVDSHREGIKAKLELKNAAELNRRAVQWVLENG